MIRDRIFIDFGMILGPLDILGSRSLKFHFVEVKNVTLRESGEAIFPDSVTTRGQKHISELMELIQRGHTAELLFTVQRTDCEIFKPADHIDPEYGRRLREAQKLGLKITAYPVEFKKDQVALKTSEPLQIKL